jgi:hypothetical protein
MAPIHEQLAAGRWHTLSLVEQLANVGSDMARAARWYGKDQQRSRQAFERALELLDLTIADDRWKGRRKELPHARELLCGAMFAPKPFDVAKEMVGVTKPGGRVVMGNWIPNDPTLVAQILKISAAYSPPPPEGFVSPMTWGMESNVIERFDGAGVPKERISFV